MARGDDSDIQIRERLVRVETQLVGLASASTILTGKAEAELASVRTLIHQEIANVRSGHGEHAEKIAKLEAIAARFEIIEERLDKVRQDVTGSHRVVVDPRIHAPDRKSEPPARHEPSWLAHARLWSSIVLALLALLSTLVSWLVHQH